MRFENLYRVSFYIMLFLATLVLNIEDSRENWVAWLLPPVVAVTAVMAFLTVDRNPRYGFSLGTATLCSWLAIVLCYLEYRLNENRLIESLTHWLVYLQLIKMLRPKNEEDEWFLILIGLVQVMVGGVLSKGGDTVGILIVAWALWTLWTLGLFYLHRAARRAANRGPEKSSGPGKGRHYIGLVDKAFLASSFSVAIKALILGGLIFLLMPRFNNRGPLRLGGGGKAAQTGFNADQVSLGQAGRILENTKMVMTVALSDPSGKSIGPLEEEPLWRGSTLARYNEDTWNRVHDSASASQQSEDDPQSQNRSLDGSSLDQVQGHWIRQDYAMEHLEESTRFAMRPILRTQIRGASESNEAQATPDGLSIDKLDGSLITHPDGSRIREYSVWSAYGPAGPAEIPQKLENKAVPPDAFEALTIGWSQRDRNTALSAINANTGITKDLRRAFAKIAAGKIEAIPETDAVGRARALEHWLRDSGEFSYSLAMTRTDRALDPVLDFLTNHKRGHCVYYASALALMLRSLDIPARIVNGYKGGDWNAISRRYHVRQKHAHSWVEALVLDKSGRQGIWLTLDPTPSAARDELVAQVGGSWFPGLQQISEAIRYYWVFYVQGFDAERQQRMIYQPLKDMFQMAGRGYQMIWDAIRWLFHFPDLQSFFNVRGFFVSFLAGTGLVFLFRAARSIWRRLARWLRPGGPGRAGPLADVAFYKRLVSLLSSQGLERANAETPREFGSRAIANLTARCGDDSLLDVPRQVIEAFYRVRYGNEAIENDEARDLREKIDRLEQALQPA